MNFSGKISDQTCQNTASTLTNCCDLLTAPILKNVIRLFKLKFFLSYFKIFDFFVRENLELYRFKVVQF